MKKEIKGIDFQKCPKYGLKNHKVLLKFKGDQPNEEISLTTLMCLIQLDDNKVKNIIYEN
jgi:hypothetical protein|tara:strand:+ start:49 stop:228 length:180 start_codon:yes stop_codon:yes gene_type:complete